MAWVSNSSVAYGSQSPPIIPDGRFSRIRFEVAALPNGHSLLMTLAFLQSHPLKLMVCVPVWHSSLLSSLAITDGSLLGQLCVWPRCSHDSGCVPRGPLLQEVLPPLFATTASCASPSASLPLRSHTRSRVFAAWTTHGWSVDLPDVTLANLSLDASSPTPVAPEVHSPVSSLWTAALPEFTAGRRRAIFRAATSARGRISGLQTFLYVKASSFACHPGRSYRCGTFSTGQPWRLNPSTLWVVTFPYFGYASRLNRATDDRRTCTSLDSQLVGCSVNRPSRPANFLSLSCRIEA
jgi:hypothetical protein